MEGIRLREGGRLCRIRFTLDRAPVTYPTRVVTEEESFSAGRSLDSVATARCQSAEKGAAYKSTTIATA